ncbi:MAG: SRPBCC domain-containing protein [Gemmatimonadota bacterium]
MTETAAENEIRILRIYDAPVALVWDAWTDLAQVAQWWGPRGFTITTHSKDLRVGGSWEYTMHGPDGTDWPNFTRYHEVVPQQRLVYDHGASSADAAPMFRVTASFRDLGGKTELDMRMALPTVEAAQQARVFIKAAGGNSTWDRLAEYIEKEVSQREVFVIARTFDAPVTTVFDMWTTPDRVAAWLPPAGFTMTFRHADITPGGSADFAMANGDFTMYARHHYHVVQRPDRLEYTQVFTDADGVVSRHPGAPTWPETTRVCVLFDAESPSLTRVSVKFTVEGEATPEEMATFVAERAGMTKGWNGSFDALDAVLVSQGAEAHAVT